MATVRLPIIANFSSSGTPNLGRVGLTSEGTPTNFTWSLFSGATSAMYDSSDVTYVTLTGNLSAGQGVGGDPGAVGSGVGSIGNLVPGNSTVSAVRYRLRARKTTCDSATVYAFRGATAVTLEEAGVTTFQVTTPDFTEYVVDLPYVPNLSPITSTWPSRGTAALSDIYNASSWGLLVASNCATGGDISVDVSELSLEVDVVPPTPVVTTGASQAGVGGAVLNGTVNPNQDQCLHFGLNGFVSTLFPVSWQFYLGAEPTSLSPIGSPAGAFICGPPNNNATPDNIDHPVATSKTWAVSTRVQGLSPATTYYFALAAIVDGITTMGSVVGFRTPSTDPSFGAF